MKKILLTTLYIIKLASLVLVISLGLGLFGLSHQIFGFRGFIVRSGSMEPAISTGSLVITQKISPYDLKTHDIITFLRPGDNKEFITHRIIEIGEVANVIAFKTQGDKNNDSDSWEVIGGSVVGKVVLVYPIAGYILSFTQGKLGILLFILIPSLLIIADEIRVIISLLNNKKSVATPVVILSLVTVTIWFNGPVSYTQALLFDTASLLTNSYVVSIITPTPVPTSTPSPSSTPICPHSESIIIEGNGAGSTNSIDISSSCTQTYTSSSQTDTTISVNVQTNTGNNQTNNNTSSTSIVTSNSSSDAQVAVSQSSNQ